MKDKLPQRNKTYQKPASYKKTPFWERGVQIVLLIGLFLAAMAKGQAMNADSGNSYRNSAMLWTGVSVDLEPGDKAQVWLYNLTIHNETDTSVRIFSRNFIHWAIKILQDRPQEPVRIHYIKDPNNQTEVTKLLGQWDFFVPVGVADYGSMTVLYYLHEVQDTSVTDPMSEAKSRAWLWFCATHWGLGSFEIYHNLKNAPDPYITLIADSNQYESAVREMANYPSVAYALPKH